MTRNEFRKVIAGMLCALGANVIGWALAFPAGAETIRPGWAQGLLSNIPLGAVIILCMLISIFNDDWSD